MRVGYGPSEASTAEDKSSSTQQQQRQQSVDLKLVFFVDEDTEKNIPGDEGKLRVFTRVIRIRVFYF